MFDFEMPHLIRFFMQLGAAIAGAASLWGAALMRQRNRTAGREELADMCIRIFFGAFIVFLIAWFALFLVFSPRLAGAHEGLALPVLQDAVSRGISLNAVPVLLLAANGFVLIFLRAKRKSVYARRGAFLFFVQFLLLSFITGFSVFSGVFDVQQLHYFLHGWHSIFTLGTVLTLDILFFATLRKRVLREALFPYFPAISAVIFIGLGLDFASAFLVFEEVSHVNAQLLFNQTVVAVIILNGALLSGKITEMLFASLRSQNESFNLPPRENFLFELSGSLSIVSWLTITFLDFAELPFSYAAFLALYLAAIVIAFASQRLLKGATTD